MTGREVLAQLAIALVLVGCGGGEAARKTALHGSTTKSPSAVSRSAGDAQPFQSRSFRSPTPGPADVGQQPLNVLVVALDNVRADRMSSYGGPNATTPNLDALAARGVRFKKCISQAPYTPHSFASMFSSLFVSDLQVRPRVRVRERTNERLVVERAGLEPYHVTLAEALQGAGYATGAVVQGWFTGGFGLQQGFEWVDYKRRRMPQVVDTSLEWLQRWAREGSHRPFFLFSYSLDVHMEFMEGRSAADHVFDGDPDGFNYTRDSMKQVRLKEIEPSSEDFANALTLYDEGLYWTDRELAPLLHGLEELGLTNSTIVVVVSDHGEAFGEHGFLSHNQSNFANEIDVPLIIVDPRLAQGRVVESRVMNVDVMPTILDLVGVPIPAMAKGLSLVPVMSGEAQPELAARPLFSEGALNGFLGAVIAEPYKLLLDRKKKAYLYDLAADPSETDNLARREPELVRQLEGVLFRHKVDGLATQLLLAAQARVDLNRFGLPNLGMLDRHALELSGETAGESMLSEEARKQLEALGYL